MHHPLFSIIIPSKDRPQSLKACLESVVVACQALQAHLASKDSVYEIIVCDDGLSPDARTLLQAFPAVRYLEGPHQGPAANRNAGAKASQGIWLIFIDDDCIASPEWLLELYKHTAHSQALEGCIEPTGHFEDLWKCPINTQGGNFWSANIAIKKELFTKVGGFDSFFPYPAYEDTDLYLRLQKETTIPFVKEAIVFHPITHLSLAAAIGKELRVLQSRAYLLAKHQAKHSFLDWLKVFAKEYRIHSLQLLHSLKKGLCKSTLLNSLILIFLLPVLIYWTLRYSTLCLNN